MNLKNKLLKKLLKWASEKENNFSICNDAFKKNKNKEKHLHLIYSSWYIEQNVLKLVILGHFCSFIPPKTPNIKILE